MEEEEEEEGEEATVDWTRMKVILADKKKSDSYALVIDREHQVVFHF